MRHLHRWGRPEECGALNVRYGGSFRVLRGEKSRCLLCGMLRKQTHGAKHATYSRDHGQTWGSIGGPCPPCTRKRA